jgi:hypothetical protein
MGRKVYNALPMTVRLSKIAEGRNAIAYFLKEAASNGTASNKLFQSAIFKVSEPGTWQVSILLGSDSNDFTPGSTALAGRSGQQLRQDESGEAPLSFQMDVSPPPPPWMELAPWIAWPFAAVALFIFHQRLASGPRR